MTPVDTLAVAVTELPSLEHLDVSSCDLMGRPFERVIAALAPHTGFTSLNVSDNLGPSRPSSMEILTIPRLPHLQHLSANFTLQDCMFDGSAWVVSMASTLTHVELEYARMQPHHVRSLARVQDFRSSWVQGRPSAVSRAMRSLVGLTRMVLRECGQWAVHDNAHLVDVRSLDHVRRLAVLVPSTTSLRTLDVSWSLSTHPSAVSKEGYMRTHTGWAILFRKVSMLQTLDLSGNSIMGARAFELGAALPALQDLRSLDLSENDLRTRPIIARAEETLGTHPGKCSTSS